MERYVRGKYFCTFFLMRNTKDFVKKFNDLFSAE